LAQRVPPTPARRFNIAEQQAPVAPVSSWLAAAKDNRDLTRFAILDEGIMPRRIKSY